MAIIKTPVPFSGVRGGLTFVDGVSDTDDVWLIQWFKERGYEVIDGPDEVGGMEGMTVKELKDYAADKGISLENIKNKADIIAAIKAGEEGGKGDDE